LLRIFELPLRQRTLRQPQAGLPREECQGRLTRHIPQTGPRTLTPIHFFARALHVFGELQALEHLLDTPKDEIGLALMDEQLPKRVRGKSGTPSGAL